MLLISIRLDSDTNILLDSYSLSGSPKLQKKNVFQFVKRKRRGMSINSNIPALLLGQIYGQKYTHSNDFLPS